MLYLSMFSVFNLPNKNESRNKYLTMDKKEEEKSPQETESDDELPRVRLGGALVDADAVPVLIRYAWKQRSFKVCFFFMTQFLKTRSCRCYHFDRVSGSIMFYLHISWNIICFDQFEKQSTKKSFSIIIATN